MVSGGQWNLQFFFVDDDSRDLGADFEDFEGFLSRLDDDELRVRLELLLSDESDEEEELERLLRRSRCLELDSRDFLSSLAFDLDFSRYFLAFSRSLSESDEYLVFFRCFSRYRSVFFIFVYFSLFTTRRGRKLRQTQRKFFIHGSIRK